MKINPGGRWYDPQNCPCDSMLGPLRQLSCIPSALLATVTARGRNEAACGAAETGRRIEMEDPLCVSDQQMQVLAAA